MARKTRTPEQVLRDRADVAARYCRGETQAAIASRFGVSREQIKYDLEQVRREWLASSLRDFDAAKAEELAKIDHLEVVAWDAWERSVGQAVTTTEKTIAIKAERPKPKPVRSRKMADPFDDDPREADAGFAIETVERTETLVGEDRFLARVAWCIDRRCKIFGVDAPTKVAPTSPDGREPYEGGDPWASIDAALNQIAKRTLEAEEQAPQ